MPLDQRGRAATFGLGEFADMHDADADGLSVDELECVQNQLAAQQTQIDGLKAKLHRVLLRRYEGDTKQTLRQKGQDGGTVTYGGNSGRVVKVTVPKLVEWDQDELRKTVDDLAAQNENLDEYVSFVVRVKEAKYKSWPEHIQKRFDPARTVKQGKIGVKIERKGA